MLIFTVFLLVYLNQTIAFYPSHQYTNTTNTIVQYDLECKADTVFCDKVSKAIAAAIDELTRVINIKNSLLILVKYHSFCEKICANDTFGWGSPTSQFTLPFEDGADLNYVYPQALAKQLAPYSSTSVWSKYDIEIEINSDLYLMDSEEANGKYWFVNESRITPDQIDFRYLVLHELLHGLGFLSSWAAYFWTKASPFRILVDGVIDPLELQLVTPGPYWFIHQDTGPAYVTGFQPNMIFDKYLVHMDPETNTNASLSDMAFDMQNFCVQNSDAFIVNFLHAFNAANQSTTAHKLWLSLSQPETLQFRFQPPSIANSSYNHIPYLQQTYQNMTLLTGNDLFQVFYFEQTDPTINRPGLMISHLGDQYQNTVDFLMTQHYHVGQTLEILTNTFYQAIPSIDYHVSLSNGTRVTNKYKSPIGPGILRILDSIGYSTVLTNTNYTTDGSVKTPRSRSICDDSNHGPKPTPTYLSSSDAVSLDVHLCLCLMFITMHLVKHSR
ncbi:uncharacterized protein B0P05DRAFT_635537 [Gilbertella persicaria]|uniref:uncharacterized protein n=1 Tax=Gilbertella persicaria TaxID=101096 RepID=UPI002220E62C|nr:uncharacterized protein B0P05DRAFT_635537 [Gilbertella persicaria]KAI8086829.1 hypothetical protein B0P05DRAFT_635537 [Gilbertella persicaria]